MLNIISNLKERRQIRTSKHTNSIGPLVFIYGRCVELKQKNMKRIFTILFLILLSSPLFSQNDEFNTADLRRTAKIVEFEFAKNLKYMSNDKLMEFYSSIEADRRLIKTN